MSFNLATILTETALAAPDAPVCRFAGAATTYRQLDEQSDRLAADGEIRFVGELPKGAWGKILKSALRDG